MHFRALGWAAVAAFAFTAGSASGATMPWSSTFGTAADDLTGYTQVHGPASTNVNSFNWTMQSNGVLAERFSITDGGEQGGQIVQFTDLGNGSNQNFIMTSSFTVENLTTGSHQRYGFAVLGDGTLFELNAGNISQLGYAPVVSFNPSGVNFLRIRYGMNGATMAALDDRSDWGGALGHPDSTNLAEAEKGRDARGETFHISLIGDYTSNPGHLVLTFSIEDDRGNFASVSTTHNMTTGAFTGTGGVSGTRAFADGQWLGFAARGDIGSDYLVHSFSVVPEPASLALLGLGGLLMLRRSRRAQARCA